MFRFFSLSFLILLIAKGFCGENLCGEYYKYAGKSCCSSPDCKVEFAVEWLYMLPAYDQPYFSIRNGTGSGTTAPFFDGERLANEQTWHSGVRADGIYYFPNCVDHVRLRGTYFPQFVDSRENDDVSSAILNFPVGGAVDAATFSSINDKFDFFYVELLFGRPVYCYCPLILNLEVGAQFVGLDFKEKVEYFTNTTTPTLRQIDYQSKLRGIGPELSFDFAYGVLPCLTINGRATSSLIVSKRDARADQQSSTGGTIAATKNDSYWRSTPIVDFRIGVNYHHCFTICGCTKINTFFELGYEVIHFFKSADRIYFVDDMNNGSSFDQNMDFTLHGPYLHFGFCF